MHKNDFCKYPTAFTSWGAVEQEAIARVMSSGRFTMGEEVERFEQELANYHGVKHAVMVNSGSSANLVAVAALFHVEKHPLRVGDRAIAPALAWPTLYAPLVQHGLRLILVDAGGDWNMQPSVVPADAALVVGCSILGNPMVLEWWEARAHRMSAHFIEDNCESIGAARDGKFCGTFGRMGTLSFYHSHQLSAIEGGAVITDDEECATICRMLRNHGWTKGTTRQPLGFHGEYHFELMGWNVRPLELHAAIAREQLRRLDAGVRARRANYAHMRKRTEGLPLDWPNVDPRDTTNPFGMAFCVEDAVTRARLAAQLRSAGIDCRPPVGGSFRRHPYSRHATFTGETPIADLIHDTGLFLGNAPYPITDLIDEAVDIMRATL